MRGSQYPIQVRERALALLATSNNVQSVATKLKLPYNTVYEWKQLAEKDEEFKEFRRENKEQFIRKAWNIVQKAAKIVDENLDSCDAVEAAKVTGIFFDKLTVATGDPTQTVQVQHTFEDFVHQLLEEGQAEVIDVDNYQYVDDPQQAQTGADTP